ncbi:hypothetical protein ACFL2Q_07530 [Thermodesulfobacteriota bacterium]
MNKFHHSLLLRIPLLFGVMILLCHVAVPFASAGYFPVLPGGYSPFLKWPDLYGEVRLRPILVQISSGKNSLPSRGFSWDLREDFGFDEPRLFVDTMIRWQVGRISFRTHLEFREFTGNADLIGTSASPRPVPRFEYTGFRFGGEFDIFQRNLTRVGLNIDYEIFQGIFTESIRTSGGGKKISESGPITIGAHAVFSPQAHYYGVSGIVEGRARWSIHGGVNVTDWEVSAGIRSAETFLGSCALKGGFRQTHLEFRDHQMWNGVNVPGRFEAVLDGWFGELVYYY